MWDTEVDIAVIGFGGAGASAAITSFDAGANVVILEKNPSGGGNTQYSGGSIRTYLDVQKAVTFIQNVCEGTTEKDVAESFVNESSQNRDWVAKLGGEIIAGGGLGGVGFPMGLPGAAFPFLPGADGIGPRVRVRGAGEGGIDLWGVLLKNVEKRQIPVLYSTAAVRLETKENEGVIGVKALKEGKEIRIRTKRGVILSCGGFEYNASMHLNYLGQKYFALGNPGNTGDGIRMACELGADLWHMNGVAANFGYKVPDFECAIRHFMTYAGFIYVDQNGRRFMDETGTDMHAMWAPSSQIDMKTLQRTRHPCYLIFDEDTRTRGPIARTERGKVSDLYQWSADNSTEIQKGWIKAADNIGILAAELGMRPDYLQSTISQYNVNCVGGYDPEFGRSTTTLIPIARTPYYAIALWPSLYNTQGGPKRNGRAQVLDVWGNPIKRLYSAGELGSLWHRNYPGGGNVSEALAFGRIAGRNAAAETPQS
jgi:succinate dehydrogenase/fumarate reductase flavoprotein subunit